MTEPTPRELTEATIAAIEYWLEEDPDCEIADWFASRLEMLRNQLREEAA